MWITSTGMVRALFFFEIGGEGTLTGPPGGYMATLAKKYSALLVALEHRFYGESIPNGNSETSNLKYLAVDQALADLASFIDYYKVEGKTGDSLWFVFGGSYPGALASWFRHSYPDHSVGSLSSSGVVNCIVDFPEFDMQVTAAIGNECADQIKRIQGAFERTIAMPGGWDAALDMFYCEKDMWTEDFYYMIADSWSMADQYSSKSSLCSAILSVGTDADDATLTKTFADFSNSYWGTDFCSGGFYNTEALADPARWDVNSRSWRWQTCFEVSYFNTAPAQGSLRSKTVDLDYHLKQCAYIFGQKMFPSSAAINREYGGASPLAHNVFYTDFADDPWQRASVDYPVSSDQPYSLAMCDDCGHCLDLHTPSESDPQQLKDTRAEFETYLAKWLNEASV
mmetsp:Transcript_2794/g.4211  ORF Transcript_2794/g.4211 Transcript_2794/m.4211 type:complete len:397 (-) Transcript_2794:206-1396(-)